MSIATVAATQAHAIFNSIRSPRPQPQFDPTEPSTTAQSSAVQQQSRAQEAQKSINLLV